MYFEGQNRIWRAWKTSILNIARNNTKGWLLHHGPWRKSSLAALTWLVFELVLGSLWFTSRGEKNCKSDFETWGFQQMYFQRLHYSLSWSSNGFCNGRGKRGSLTANSPSCFLFVQLVFSIAHPHILVRATCEQWVLALVATSGSH